MIVRRLRGSGRAYRAHPMHGVPLLEALIRPAKSEPHVRGHRSRKSNAAAKRQSVKCQLDAEAVRKRSGQLCPHIVEREQ